MSVTIRNIVRCRTCGAEIFWATTRDGKRIPIDAVPVSNGNVLIESVNGMCTATVVGAGGGEYVSHFMTCPHAAWHRKSPAEDRCVEGSWVVS